MKLNLDFTKYIGKTLLKDWWPAVLDHIRQIQNAVNTNDTALTTEVSDRKKAVSDETTARQNADTALGTRVTTETTERKAADTTLQQNITNEETARISKDNTLGELIQSLSQSLSTETSSVRREIEREAEARMTADNTKADKATHMGFIGGQNAQIDEDGGGAAVGRNSESGFGGAAMGYNAKAARGGGAVGSGAKSTGFGGAVGLGAEALNGFSGGSGAISNVDAIQLGTGTNTKERTLQVYDYMLMDANGKIPAERISNINAGLDFHHGNILPEELEDDVIYCSSYAQGLSSFCYSPDGGWKSYRNNGGAIEDFPVGEAFTVYIESGDNMEGYLYIDDERKYVLRNIQRLEAGMPYIVRKLKEIGGKKPDLIADGEVIAEEIPDPDMDTMARFFIKTPRGVLEIGDTLRLEGKLLDQGYLIDELSKNKAERNEIPSELPPISGSVTMEKLAADVRNAITMGGGGTTAVDQISMEIAVPKSGWVNEADPDGYDYRIDISAPIITSEQEPELTFHKSSLPEAAKAGICAEAETTDGALRLWARRKPDADMTARIRLMVPKQ